MGKCKYSPTWAAKTDPNGYVVQTWGSKHSDSEMKCSVCNAVFSCTGGWQSVKQHSLTKLHRDNCSLKLNPNQGRLFTDPGPRERSAALTPTIDTSTDQPHQPTVRLSYPRDEATRAELLWVMKIIKSNYSFNSCSDLGGMPRAMFPTAALPQEFSLGASKAKYLLTDALAPYFNKELIRDMAGSFYSIAFDETCNAASQKELQVLVTYWSQRFSGVVTQHLQTFFIGHATAAVIKKKLYEALDDNQLPREKLVMLSKDGPNVNKTVENQINADLLALRGKRLVALGSDNLHIVHNAFLAGLSAFGEDAADFLTHLYLFFHDWPSRWEDYEGIQEKLKLPLHKFLKHISAR